MKTLYCAISCALAAALWGVNANYAASQRYAASNEASSTLKILSYNVHNFVGMDDVRNYKRIADVINAAAPDIVAIQEADSATQRSAGVYTLQEAAAMTGMFPTFAAAIEYQGGKYGIGILSKVPPIAVKRYPLPGREERRVLLVAEFEKYIVACTHFSLNNADRLASVHIINEIVRGAGKPFFLAGDMNCVPHSQPQIAIDSAFAAISDTAQSTFPADNPKHCLDYIYQYRGGRPCAVLQSRIIDEPVASDHRPVFVEVRLQQ